MVATTRERAVLVDIAVADFDRGRATQEDTRQVVVDKRVLDGHDRTAPRA